MNTIDDINIRSELEDNILNNIATGIIEFVFYFLEQKRFIKKTWGFTRAKSKTIANLCRKNAESGKCLTVHPYRKIEDER